MLLLSPVFSSCTCFCCCFHLFLAVVSAIVVVIFSRFCCCFQLFLAVVTVFDVAVLTIFTVVGVVVVFDVCKMF